MARLKSFSRQGFEPLEDRKLMAVDLGASTFSPALMGDAIEELSTGNAVGFGYAINLNGDNNAAVGSGGLARTAPVLAVLFFLPQGLLGRKSTDRV